VSNSAPTRQIDEEWLRVRDIRPTIKADSDNETWSFSASSWQHLARVNNTFSNALGCDVEEVKVINNAHRFSLTKPKKITASLIEITFFAIPQTGLLRILSN